MKIKTFCCLALFTLISTLIAAQTALCSPPPKIPTTNWAQFHFDSCHTGYNPYEHILNSSNVGNLVKSWSQSIEVQGAYLWPPTIANGIAYVTTATYGDGPNILYAFNATSGARIWQVDMQDTWLTTPAVADGMVYTGGTLALHALNATTGAPVWKLAAAYGAFTPTVADGVVYVALINNGLPLGSQAVYALDAHTGTILWKHPFGAVGDSVIAVANGVLYVDATGAGGNLWALNAADGGTIWQQQLASGGLSMVANNKVYVAASDGIYAFNAFTGALIWKQAGYRNNGTAVANGILFAESSASIVALAASDGTLIWTVPLTLGDGSPVVANGVVYTGGSYPNLVALDANTGAQLWQYATTCGVGAQTVVNGTVYLATNGHTTAGKPPSPTDDCGEVIAFGLPK